MAFIGIGAAVATALGFAGSAFVAGAVDFAVTITASVGISLAAQALAGKPPAAAASISGGMQGSLQAGGAVARAFPLGTCATAGSLVYANEWGFVQEGDPTAVAPTPNAYFTQVFALSDLPGCTLQGLWVNGQPVTLGASPGAMGSAIPEYNKDVTDHLWIKYYDGTQTVADPFLIASVSSADRPYESTRVGTGIAYAVVTALTTSDTLWTGIPSFKFQLSGIPLYDPTKDSTNGGSGSQVYSDPTTWGGDGDDLPAVQAYNVLRGIKYNGAWFYGLQKTTQANLPTINWNAQIGKCRATITGVAGPEPTYRAGGPISVNSLPADALDSIMTACQGKISEVGGFYKVHLGTPDSFTFEFTDDDILSTEDQTYTPFLTLADSINGITGTYPDPTQAWNTTTAPAIYNADFEAEDGSRRLLANPTFDLVPYAEQVQRLMSSALSAARRERSHAIILPPPFWTVEPGDVGRWNSVRNGYVDKDFEVTTISDKGNCDVGVNLQEIDPTDYDWNHDTDFKPPMIGATTYPRPDPQGIVDWFAEGTVINDSSGSARRPAIALSWDGDMPGVIGVQYEVRLKSDSSSVTRGRTDQLAAGTLLISQSLLPNTVYQARGQYLPSAPRDMLWSDWLDATTPDVRLTLADFDDSVIAMVNGIEQFDADAINKTLNLLASLLANVNGRVWNVQTELTSQISATFETSSASITDVKTVSAASDAALASDISTVTATLGDGFSEVSTVTEAVATLDGYAASVTVDVDVNGFVVGTKLINGGPGADEFVVTTDKFQVAAPGVSGGDALPIFTVANVNGVPQIAISADLYADGSINALAVNAGTLSALSADLGTITTGLIETADGKMVIDMVNQRIIFSE